MKLHLSLLERIIDLRQVLGTRELEPIDSQALRHLLDDVVSDVKDVETDGGRVVYTVEALATRGDHFCALGIARELSARSLQPIKYPSLAPEIRENRTSVPVYKDTEKCLRYALMEMHLPADLPLRGDIASILNAPDPSRHAIVHTLNYILLELGQPMHAFDREKIEGEVRIVVSENEEVVEALDGKSYRVPAGSILIRDKKKTIAVAGIIGLSNSMVTPATRRVLVESATFDPVSVRKAARGMGVATDASFVFERGADIDAVVPALKRLAYLLAGGSSSDAAHVVGTTIVEGKPTEKRTVKLNLSTLRKQMNLPRLQEAEVLARLKNLGFSSDLVLPDKPSDKDLKFMMTVPSWRLFDVRNEEDVIEEFVRVHGLNSVKLELPRLDPESRPLHPLDALMRDIESALHGNGFYEVITKSLVSSDEVEFVSSLDPKLGAEHVGINNAIEINNSHLKVTNILSLYRLADKNHRHGVSTFKAYEMGRLFRKTEDLKAKYGYERDVLSLAFAGRWYEGEWKGVEDLNEQLTLFKGVLQSIHQALGIRVRVEEGTSALLHPGYQGTLKAGRKTIGIFGVAHPSIKESISLKFPLMYAEIDMDSLLELREERPYATVVDLPSIRRDLTLKIGARDFAARVASIVASSKPAFLKSVSIVDDFKKEGEDFRRTTFRLVFQNPERTLEHTEVDEAMKLVLIGLAAGQIEIAA